METIYPKGEVRSFPEMAKFSTEDRNRVFELREVIASNEVSPEEARAALALSDQPERTPEEAERLSSTLRKVLARAEAREELRTLLDAHPS